MSRAGNGHPSDGELLRYADGEVSAQEVKKIESHLAACWECRTEFAELQKTIGECVRYRQTVLKSHLPEPPKPWTDIYRRFDEIDEREAGPSWAARAWSQVQATLGWPRAWVPALATLLVAVIVVDQLRNTPSVRAAELLDKATVAAEARPLEPRHIQIRTAEATVHRVIGEGAETRAAADVDSRTLDELRPLFERANYSWEDPLSAASFAAWRNTLPEKRDEVMTVEDRRDPGERRYQIRTTTDSSELVEATLQLTMSELRPIESTLRFRDRQLIELSELSTPPPPVSPPPPVAAAVAPRSPEPITPPSPAEFVRAATPAEELQVLAVLQRLGADLGAPIEVTRDGEAVVVSGVGVQPELGERIHAELASMPRVAVEFADPASDVADPGAEVREVITPESATPPHQAVLERQLGGGAAYGQLADDLLRLNDALMSRIHALRRLSQRFPPEAESELSAEDRQLLVRLRQEHAATAADLASQLQERARPALFTLGAREPATPLELEVGDTWQVDIEKIFTVAQHTESLLVAMLGGASAEAPPEELPAEILAGLAELKARTAQYVQDSAE